MVRAFTGSPVPSASNRCWLTLLTLLADPRQLASGPWGVEEGGELYGQQISAAASGCCGRPCWRECTTVWCYVHACTRLVLAAGSRIVRTGATPPVPLVWGAGPLGRMCSSATPFHEVLLSVLVEVPALSPGPTFACAVPLPPSPSCTPHRCAPRAARDPTAFHRWHGPVAWRSIPTHMRSTLLLVGEHAWEDNAAPPSRCRLAARYK